MESASDHFGQWLRKWRKQIGLTQQQLADSVGVTKSHISNIERGKSSSATSAPPKPSLKIIDKIALVLKRPIEEAREVAGYGLGENVTAAPNSLPAAHPTTASGYSVEELLLLYFRSLPADVQSTTMAYLGSLYLKHQTPETAKEPEVAGEVSEV